MDRKFIFRCKDGYQALQIDRYFSSLYITDIDKRQLARWIENLQMQEQIYSFVD